MIKRLSNKEQRANIDYVKWVLVTAFTTDTFVPFDSFTMWQLLPGESVDVLLAELERLILLIGDALPEKWMKFAFVVVLLSHVRQHFKDGRHDPGANSDWGTGHISHSCCTNHTSPSTLASHNITCYKCSELNHFARDCQYQYGEGCSGPIRKAQMKVHCYRCWKIGHIVSECLGNRKGASHRCQSLPN